MRYTKQANWNASINFERDEKSLHVRNEVMNKSEHVNSNIILYF